MSTMQSVPPTITPATTELPPPSPPQRPFTPPTFRDVDLIEQIKTNSYRGTISLHGSLLLGGGIRGPALPLFLELADQLQQKTIRKVQDQYKRNRSISRTLHDQLLACLKRIELPQDEKAFPEEKWKQACTSLAEAERYAELMDAQAEKLREEFSTGNLRFVERLSG